VKKVKLLPMGWSLESNSEDAIVYRFNGVHEARGIRKEMTLRIKITNWFYWFEVTYPYAFGDTKSKKFNIDKRKDLDKIRKFVSNLMDDITRQFYGLSRKRTPIYNIKLPKAK